MQARQTSPGAELVRFLAELVLVSAALGLVGFLPTRRIAGGEGVRAMMLAIGVTALASAVGALPVFFARRAGRPTAQPVFSSMLVRLALVAVLAVLVGISRTGPLKPFLVWLVIGYLVLLLVDTLYAKRALGSL